MLLTTIPVIVLGQQDRDELLANPGFWRDVIAHRAPQLAHIVQTLESNGCSCLSFTGVANDSGARLNIVVECHPGECCPFTGHGGVPLHTLALHPFHPTSCATDELLDRVRRRPDGQTRVMPRKDPYRPVPCCQGQALFWPGLNGFTPMAPVDKVCLTFVDGDEACSDGTETVQVAAGTSQAFMDAIKRALAKAKHPAALLMASASPSLFMWNRPFLSGLQHLLGHIGKRKALPKPSGVLCSIDIPFSGTLQRLRGEQAQLAEAAVQAYALELACPGLPKEHHCCVCAGRSWTYMQASRCSHPEGMCPRCTVEYCAAAPVPDRCPMCRSTANSFRPKVSRKAASRLAEFVRSTTGETGGPGWLTDAWATHGEDAATETRLAVGPVWNGTCWGVVNDAPYYPLLAMPSR